MTFWSLLQNVISLAWVFQTRCPANLSSLGKLTADFIAIIKFGSRNSRTFKAYNTRQDAKRRINKATITRVPRCCIQISGALGTLFGGPGFTLNVVIKVILVCFICLNIIWVKITVPVLKSGPQIVAKTGNPAGLLFRRIWYSVGKFGVLGIAGYRQGRPLEDCK